MLEDQEGTRPSDMSSSILSVINDVIVIVIGLLSDQASCFTKLNCDNYLHVTVFCVVSDSKKQKLLKAGLNRQTVADHIYSKNLYGQL